jgi:GntR family transcriptional repressor for pyruvate dehydrogenase complex
MFQQRLTRGDLLGQHRAINVVIQNRDTKGAQAAINAHLDYVQHALEDQQTAIQNEAFARKRLDIERQR